MASQQLHYVACCCFLLVMTMETFPHKNTIKTDQEKELKMTVIWYYTPDVAAETRIFLSTQQIFSQRQQDPYQTTFLTAWFRELETTTTTSLTLTMMGINSNFNTLHHDNIIILSFLIKLLSLMHNIYHVYQTEKHLWFIQKYMEKVKDNPIKVFAKMGRLG